MPFLADLNRCEDLSKRNEWVTNSGDPGSRECVAAVKALAFDKVQSTSVWRRGKKVIGNNIMPGTAIATFPIKRSGKFRFQGHSAIFVGYVSGGIEVYDQYPAPPKPFGKRFISNDCMRSMSNNAAAFYVIELREEPSSDPLLCAPAPY